MDKFKELYDYSKEVFYEEQNRFIRLDQKASQYIAVLTLLIGFAGSFVKWILSNNLPPNTFIEWLLIIDFILVIFTLLLSWWFNFQVLKLHDLYTLPLDLTFIEFYKNNSMIDIHYSMSKQFSEALSHNITKTANKTIYLSKGYRSIRVSIVLISIFIIIFLFSNWNQNQKNYKEVSIMKENGTEQQSSESQESKPTEQQVPNENVNAPAFRLVQEGYTPQRKPLSDAPTRPKQPASKPFTQKNKK